MPSDEQAIRDVISTWIAASKSGDLETVLGLMTEDVVFLRPGHPPMVGKSAFAALAQPHPGQQPPQFDGTNEIQEIQVLGDWAFAWAKLKVIITLPGKDPMTRAGHTLSIFKKDEGKWRLARDANLLSAGES